MLIPKVNLPVTYVLLYVCVEMNCHRYLVVCGIYVPQIHTYLHTYVFAPMPHVAKVGMLP